MNYENCNIPDVASAVRHLGNLTGVECHINEVPFLKEKGLFSLPTISEDVVRIASKYGLHESVTGDVCALVNNLSGSLGNWVKEACSRYPNLIDFLKSDQSLLYRHGLR